MTGKRQRSTQPSSFDCFVATFCTSLKFGPDLSIWQLFSSSGYVCLHHTTLSQPLLPLIFLCEYMWLYDWYSNKIIMIPDMSLMFQLSPTGVKLTVDASLIDFYLKLIRDIAGCATAHRVKVRDTYHALPS